MRGYRNFMFGTTNAKKRSEFVAKSCLRNGVATLRADRIFLSATLGHFFSADSLVPPLDKKSRDEVGKMIMTRVHLSPPRTSLGVTAKSDGARRAIDSHARVWRPRSIFATRAKSTLNYCRSSLCRGCRGDRGRESELGTASIAEVISECIL